MSSVWSSRTALVVAGKLLLASAAVELVVSFLLKSYRRRRTPASVDRLVAFDDSTYACEKREPCGERYCRVHNLRMLVDAIDAARVSIDVCMYICTLDELTAAAIRAHERGVLVRVITDHDMAYNSGSRVTLFKTTGIEIKSKLSTKLMHHKFCVIDSPSRIAEIRANSDEPFKNIVNCARGKVLCGSMNWTQQAVNGNWEHVLITSHLPIVSQFQQEFDILWEKFSYFDLYSN